MGTGPRLWSRRDAGARWGSLVVLGLLAGAVAALALAAADGAQRTGTALERLRQRTNASDAVVFPSQIEDESPDWSRLEARPEVKQVARWALLDGSVDGESGDTLFAPTDGAWMQRVDHPLVVAGRMFDPHASDEAVVDENVARLGYGVGTKFSFQALGAGQAPGEAPKGPTVPMHVVGVIRDVAEFVFVSDGQVIVSPGFVDRYRDQIRIAENANVQLRRGAADIDELRRDANADVAPGVPVLDQHLTARRVTTTTDVERTMLLILALVVTLVGLVLVGQAIARSAGTIATDATTLRAMGMSKRDVVSAALGPHLITAAVAMATTAAGAFALSRWFPVGLAAQIDPDRGFRIDRTLLVAGTATVGLLVVVGSAFAASLAARASTAGSDRRRAGLLPWARRVPPVTVGLGAGMALEVSGRSRPSSSAPALVGAIAAVAGIVAMVTLDHGLRHAVDHPEEAGVAWDALVVPNDADAQGNDVAAAFVDRIRTAASFAEMGVVRRAVVDIGGTGVPSFTSAPVASMEPLGFTVLHGRAPTASHEIALGPVTARALGVHVGDDVTLPDRSTARVVGEALFPNDVHSSFDEGAWIVPVDFDAQLAASPSQAVAYGGVAVRFSDRRHVEASVQRLTGALGASVLSVDPGEAPDELRNLRHVSALPTLLALFLGVLGAAAVGHVLFSSVRRRGKDFAVLRTLGITGRGARTVIGAEGSAVAAVGIAIGVPLGMLAGRAGWRAIAGRVPLAFTSPISLDVLLLVVPVAVIAANVLALIPGRRAARLLPAKVLRGE